ncbi:unnamed protein product [Effrenium voratum]|uniref:non-specific serine/threonine protein kinase n=1 Tax=Effrenium voratum TaxID=2562239 RepID=A0AA36I6M7_9DINO|nr:unnamed protein product [Effrenium voratum]CAJ1461796.1 unnamed protein product [Effrenium voratum]|mmetsp:Transcript_119666/g.284260  ORF Transcript_119666/g.284260 Transcript_119666/m.284260 type:complete len:532 (-) Transcript_119666:94-1689(-)|eukprot:CAMPEP_0181474744 /NCGR_PEP_ID=MMETSP1110-20121109/40820_1 /TAXON_ID=174948 /ORGANISM="Symbiodinium sp., Strain CCMP421" /LENGTH=531 /DNA_ID=CAMNT_0023599947 /DNA_START=61 /DNA_END=1656 /DNA_ORIENTATION=+
MRSYKRIQVVGKGSFGCCWLARGENGDRCILKQIDVSKMPEKQRLEAANEVKVLSKLRHPFIINYRESYVDSGLLCIVMDFAERGDLYRMIGKQRAAECLFAESLVLRWFTQIALALKHIHDRHILHRDLKTQNIFLAGSDPGMVKVGDFGIARVLRHTQDCARTAIGTPFYLSPEICQEKPYSYKSDVWSLGCVLYEMATLRHAFDAESMRGLVLKILRGVPPQVPTVFSREFRNLIPEMLTKDPQCRPAVHDVLQRPLVRTMIRQLLLELEKQGPVISRQRSASPKASPALEARNRCSRMSALQPKRSLKERQSSPDVRPIRPRSESRDSSRSNGRTPSPTPAALRQSAGSSVKARKDRCAPDQKGDLPERKSVSRFRQDLGCGSFAQEPQQNCSQHAEDGASKAAARQDLIRTLEEGLVLKQVSDVKEVDHDEGLCHPRFLHPDGDEIKLPVGAADSLSYRIEALRLYLEKELGLKDFLLAYRCLQSAAKDVLKEPHRAQDLDSILSSKAIGFLPLVTQLIVCEDEFY